MAFKFRLQRVLQVKELKENILRDKFSGIARLYNSEIEILREQERVYRDSIDQLRNRLKDTSSAEEMVDYHHYIQGLVTRSQRQQARVEEVGVDLNKARSDLVEALKEKSAIEKLKERHYQNYMKEVERREQNQIGEIALNLPKRGPLGEPRTLSANSEGGGG